MESQDDRTQPATAPPSREADDRSGPPVHASCAHHRDDCVARTETLETIFARAPLGIGIVDLQGRATMTNEVVRSMLGYSEAEFAAMSWTDFTHKDDIARNIELSLQLTAGEIDHFSMEKRFICRDGGVLWAELTVSAVHDARGEVDYVIGMVQDITERKRLESDLRAAEQRYRLLVERQPAVVYVAEPGALGRWFYVSPKIEAMLGFTAEEWMGDPGLWLRQLHPHDAEAELATEARIIDTGEAAQTPSSSTYRLRHRDGSTVWVRDDALLVEDEEGRTAFHGVLVDVTAEKRLEERLEHQAFHDALTGLPNRQLFHDRVEHSLTRARRGTGHVAVLFVDLDNFKTINDTFGHARGDEVIVRAASRLQSCVRGGDTAARLGGDEFAVLVEGTTAERAAALADRVLATFSESPLDCGGQRVTVGASIGIAVAGPGDSTETLLRNADLAMYQAKLRGRGRHVTYEPAMHSTVAKRFHIEESLQRALSAGAIAVAYQPIADLESGRVVGLEALARWTDPQLGHVSPAEFIPVAEQTGLIHELGRQVLEQACSDLGLWQARTGCEAYVAVNVSPLQLDADRFASTVLQVLRDHGLEPTSLVLEVTEGLLLAQVSRESLRKLRDLGVRVAIDDFGTGYSSLAYLSQLPVDMVKIDQAFLGSASTGPENSSFLSAVVGLVDTVGLTTICEGIETHRQLAEVQATRCGHGQGYLLGRPGPVADVPATIQAIRRVGLAMVPASRVGPDAPARPRSGRGRVS